MTEQGLINLKIRKKNELLESQRSELSEIKQRKDEIYAKVNDNSTSEEIAAVEEELKPIADEEKSKAGEVAKTETEISDLEKELEDVQNELLPPASNDGEGEERNMNREEMLEQRNAVNDYIRSKGHKRDGFTSVDGEAIIPVDKSNVPTDEKGGIDLDLATKVTIIPVTTSSGSQPILKKTDAVLHTVEELEANPELAKPQFNEVDYKIATYRGFIPVSAEAIADSEVNLVVLVEKHIKRIEKNTKNLGILNILKTFTAKTAASIDDLKTIKNVDMQVGYSPEWLVTKSFYNEVDKLKDKEGRYLFQESLVSPTGFMFLGRPVSIVEDTHLGVVNDKKAFFGDLEAAVALFDRAQLGVKWVDHNTYGELLRGGMRMDIKKADVNAGFLITTTGLQPVEDTEGA